MKKVLVAYFSYSGKTRRAAETLAQAVGADLFEIAPAVPYTDADLDWTNSSSRTSVEMKDVACRPDIAGTLENAGDYDVVFVGFPIWWYTAPRVVDTFLDRYGFAGKTVVPFATSGGSGIGGAEAELAKICPSAHWEKGRIIKAGDDAEALAAWAKTYL